MHKRKIRTAALSAFVSLPHTVALHAGLCRHHQHDVDHVHDTLRLPDFAQGRALLQRHRHGGVRAVLHPGLHTHLGSLRFLLPHDHDPDVLLRLGVPRQQVKAEEGRLQRDRQPRGEAER